MAGPLAPRISEAIDKERLEIALRHVGDIVVARVFGSLPKHILYGFIQNSFVPQRSRPTDPEKELVRVRVGRRFAGVAAIRRVFAHPPVIDEVFCTVESRSEAPAFANYRLECNSGLFTAEMIEEDQPSTVDHG